MKTIYDFKKGDEVVRIQPAKAYAPMLMGMDGIRDRSYMGEKLIFIGIANGQIYLKRTSAFDLAVFGDKMLNLSLDIWDEGWDIYVNPESLLHGEGDSIDTSVIQQQIDKAVAEENYELAEKLKAKLLKK